VTTSRTDGTDGPMDGQTDRQTDRRLAVAKLCSVKHRTVKMKLKPYNEIFTDKIY